MTQETNSSRKITARVGGILEIYRCGRPNPERRIALTGTHLVVGRHEGAQLLLDHETVSRPHAELVCGPFARWWIHDLGSTNGTYVNGTRVKERMLNPGDEIRIGDFTLRLSLPRREALTTTPPPPRALPKPIEDDLAPVPASRRDLPRIDALQLTTAMALGRRLMAIEDPRGRLEELCQFLVGRDFPAISTIALRLRGPDDLKVLHGPVHRNGPAAVGGHFSRSVLSAVWQSREPVMATNATSVSAVRRLTLPGSIRPMTAIACPIWDDDERLDVIYVELPPQHGTDEWRTLVTLVADAYKQADMMWDMRRHVRSSAFVERELEMARQIQDSLVPSRARFDLLDVAIGYEPCRWVGGDYVDAALLPDGRVLLAVADVCGKGLQAALVASSLHTMVNATIEGGGGVVDLMTRINRYLMSYLPNHSFVTIACVALDPATGALECVNAGHPAPLILRRDGSMRPLQSERNLALGIADTPFEVEHTTLAADEVLLLYTDGLTELIDERRNLMGEERFAGAVRTIVADNGHHSAERLKSAILRMLEDYRGWQLANDDTTFLVARRRLAAGRAA